MVTSRVGNLNGEMHDLLGDAISSTGTSSLENQERMRLSEVRPSLRRQSKMAQLMIDAQGRTMSNEETKLLWQASGKCTNCGINRTHVKEKFGPCGVFRRMTPQTSEGISYKGYCLNCHDVPKLRVLLNKPDIPLDLPRQSPLESSIRSLQSVDAGVIELPKQKRSPIMILCSSIHFQIVCLVIFLAIAAAIVVTGIKFSKRPEVWISPAPSPAPSFTPSTITPTASPTSYEWNFSSEIVSDEVSFGYKVKLSADGNILVVHAQNFENGRTHVKEKFGPLRVFRRMTPQTSEGISYKGYCLNCHDFPKLRVLLNEPDIPLDLPRQSPLESSIRSLQSLEAGVIELPEPKRSAVAVLCSSIRFQIFTGIKLSKQPEVWISPAPSPAPSFTPSTITPTASPTSYKWNFSSQIVSDEVSFGYDVKLSADGNILVVHAQNFENGKGRFDVYAYAELLDEKKWLKLDWVLAMMSSKASSYDTQNHGIHLIERQEPNGTPGIAFPFTTKYPRFEENTCTDPAVVPSFSSEATMTTPLKFKSTSYPNPAFSCVPEIGKPSISIIWRSSW